MSDESITYSLLEKNFNNVVLSRLLTSIAASCEIVLRLRLLLVHGEVRNVMRSP